jgi:hypothetical protein
VIICAVLASLAAYRPFPHAEAGRSAAGAQIITELIAKFGSVP